MKSRRNFIAKTSMAATALLVLRPFNSLASSAIRSIEMGNNNKLVLIHTGNNPIYINYAERKISSLAKSNHNLLLLKQDTSFNVDNYEIVFRENIKTGIIKVLTGDKISAINDLSFYLKKEKNCQLVVCLSELGYKNKNGIDDITLAEKSSYIDIIIGNHAINHTPFPIVACNSKREEVIIQHAAENGFGLGNIEIEFDGKTSAKRSLAINNLLTRLPKTA